MPLNLWTTRGNGKHLLIGILKLKKCEECCQCNNQFRFYATNTIGAMNHHLPAPNPNYFCVLPYQIQAIYLNLIKLYLTLYNESKLGAYF